MANAPRTCWSPGSASMPSWQSQFSHVCPFFNPPHFSSVKTQLASSLRLPSRPFHLWPWLLPALSLFSPSSEPLCCIHPNALCGSARANSPDALPLNRIVSQRSATRSSPSYSIDPFVCSLLASSPALVPHLPHTSCFSFTQCLVLPLGVVAFLFSLLSPPPRRSHPPARSSCRARLPLFRCHPVSLLVQATLPPPPPEIAAPWLLACSLRHIFFQSNPPNVRLSPTIFSPSLSAPFCRHALLCSAPPYTSPLSLVAPPRISAALGARTL